MQQAQKLQVKTDSYHALGNIIDEQKGPSSFTDHIHINHVMSQDIQSDIFNQFITYLSFPKNSTHKETIAPLPEAHVYHYHRIHIEAHEIKTPSVVTVHHDLTENNNWLQFEHFEKAYREVSKIVCLNSQQEHFLRQRGYRHTCVIPHGYHNGVFHTPHDHSARERERVVLGLASRRYPRRVKGEAFLMELAKRLDPQKFEFVLIGRGRSYDAVQLHELGYEVRVFEYLPYRLFNDFYRTIDALLILSGHEGGPACVPEAVATGTPMFATAVGMVRDYLVDEHNGLILTGDPDADAWKIRTAAHGDLLRTWQRNAFAGAATAWTWCKVAQAYDQLYREVASHA